MCVSVILVGVIVTIECDYLASVLGPPILGNSQTAVRRASMADARSL